MLRYPVVAECVLDMLEHIEIVGRYRKLLEDCRRCWKAWEIVRSCGRHQKVQKLLEASEHVAGDREDFRKPWLTD